MKLKAKIAIVTAILIGIVSITIPTILFLTHSPINNNTHNYLESVMYPNPLFYRGTYSDMVLGSDDKVYFLIGSFNATYWETPEYIILDHENQTCTYKAMFPNIMSGFMHQLKLGLGPNNDLTAYLFFTNPFFDLVGVLYKTNYWGNWISYPALANKHNPYSGFYFRSVYNWNFMSSEKINLAFLYEGDNIVGAYFRPAIYNETTDSFFFLSDVFPEIQYQQIAYWEGDFAVVDSNIFLSWFEYINDYDFSVYLAINWKEEEWHLSSFKKYSPLSMPLKIFPKDDYVDIFFYDPGYSSLNSSLYRLQVYNSTYNTTTLLHQFDGTICFYQDSIGAISPNEYVFLYTKKSGSFAKYAPRDLYMGYYDGENFYEFMLTNSTDFIDHRAHLEVVENYLHYAWETSPYRDTGTYDPMKTNLYYNRIPIREIRMSKEIGKLELMPAKTPNVSGNIELFSTWLSLTSPLYLAYSIRKYFFFKIVV